MELIKLYQGTDYGAAADALADFLNEYAVPKYFDRVDVSAVIDTVGTAKIVYCYCGTTPLLTVRMEPDTTVSASIESCRAAIKVQDGGGNVLDALIADYPSGKVGVCGVFYNAYVCKGGLAFTGAPQAPAFMAITKDNAGNTAIVVNYTRTINTIPGLGVQPSGTTKTIFYIISAKSGTLLGHDRLVFSYDGQLTTLSPLPVADTSNYTVDLFYMPFTQYVTPGVYNIDGVHYLANGLWCLQDE